MQADLPSTFARTLPLDAGGRVLVRPRRRNRRRQGLRRLLKPGWLTLALVVALTSWAPWRTSDGVAWADPPPVHVAPAEAEARLPDGPEAPAAGVAAALEEAEPEPEWLAAPPAVLRKTPRVLILGLDGVRPDALRAADTPNLDRLVRGGAYSFEAQAGDRTLSGPGWTSLLTGVSRDKHGVYDNKFKGTRLARWPTLFHRVEAALPNALTAAFTAWEPIQEEILGGAPIDLREQADDETVTGEAVKLLRSADPTLLFVHLDAPDAAGHEFAHVPEQREYLDAIAATDARVGRILRALRGRPESALEDWLVLVTTDHGGDQDGHGYDRESHRTIFVVLSGPSVTPGKLAGTPRLEDVAPTVLTHLGVTPQAAWKLDGRALQTAEDAQAASLP